MMQKVHFRLTSVAQKRCCLSSLLFRRVSYSQSSKVLTVYSVFSPSCSLVTQSCSELAAKDHELLTQLKIAHCLLNAALSYSLVTQSCSELAVKATHDLLKLDYLRFGQARARYYSLFFSPMTSYPRLH